MKGKWKSFLLALAIPLAVGGLSALLTMGAMDAFEAANQPPLSPPSWLFPIAWCILYLLMGWASWRVYHSQKDLSIIRPALTVYAIQLGVNFLWSIFFFTLKLYWFSFFWLLILWVLILNTILLFRKADKTAPWLLVPYLMWVTFAGYLNFGVAWLN